MLDRPSSEEMKKVNDRVCRYRCGECPYDETASWSDHMTHRSTHFSA